MHECCVYVVSVYTLVIDQPNTTDVYSLFTGEEYKFTSMYGTQQKLLGHFNLKVIITYNLIGRFNTCNRLLYFRVVEIT